MIPGGRGLTADGKGWLGVGWGRETSEAPSKMNCLLKGTVVCEDSTTAPSLSFTESGDNLDWEGRKMRVV